MTATALGKLTFVDAREVWKHEAHDFTPWLRENIELLGLALGIELEITASEAAVGTFAVDLYGRDNTNNRALIVENQLEQTDHGHLGQLITYAAGLDAGTIIWLTPQFRDEHRQALNWLNGHTVEGLDFFGVEIELLQIGGSLPAPHFKLASQPNEWARATRTAAAAKSEPTESDLRYQDFFQAVLDEAKRRFPELTPQSQVKTTWELSMSGGRPGFLLRWRRAARKEMAVELVIEATNAIPYLDALMQRKREIESALGFSLQWKHEPNLKRQVIGISYPGSVDEAPERIAELRTWAVETMLRMVQVLRPIIKELQPLATPNGESSEQGGDES